LHGKNELWENDIPLPFPSRPISFSVTVFPLENNRGVPLRHESTHNLTFLYLVVYLSLFLLQAGYMDKAQKYTDKAIAQIEKLKSADSRPKPILSSFHVLLIEHIVQCKLVTGDKGGAVEELGHLCRLLDGGGPVLLQRHRAQLHTLLGLYAMSMNQMDLAETQLNQALRVRERCTVFSLLIGFRCDFTRTSVVLIKLKSYTLYANLLYVQQL
jgi:hypothetical protein